MHFLDDQIPFTVSWWILKNQKTYFWCSESPSWQFSTAILKSPANSLLEGNGFSWFL